MKILKIEATVACVVLWCLSLMSLAQIGRASCRERVYVSV